MNEPSEILAAIVASLALFAAIAAVDFVALPLAALVVGGLVLGARPVRHDSPRRSYHRLDASILTGEGGSA